MLIFIEHLVILFDVSFTNGHRLRAVSRYYMDAECSWSLVVQPSQTIRLTLLDFELDVRRAGACHDFVSVTYRRRRKWDDVVEVFRDCGSLGKQVLEVPASSAVVVFKTGRSTLTRRGFVIHLEGSIQFVTQLFSVYKIDTEQT